MLDAVYLQIVCPFNVDQNSNFAMKIIVHVNNRMDIIVKTIENTRAPSSSVSLTPVPNYEDRDQEATLRGGSEEGEIERK